MRIEIIHPLDNSKYQVQILTTQKIKKTDFKVITEKFDKLDKSFAKKAIENTYWNTTLLNLGKKPVELEKDKIFFRIINE